MGQTEGVGTLRIGEKPRGGLSSELTDEHAVYASSSSASEDEDDEGDFLEAEDAQSGFDEGSSSSSSVMDHEEYSEVSGNEGNDYFDLALGMQDAPKAQEPGADVHASQPTNLLPPAPASGTSTPTGEKKRKLAIPGFIKRTLSSQSTHKLAMSDTGLAPQNGTQDVPLESSSSLDVDSTPASGATTPGAYRRKKFTRRKVLIGVDDASRVGATDIGGTDGDAEGTKKKKKKRKSPKTGRRRKESHSGPSLSTGAGMDETLGIVFLEVKGANDLPRWRNMTRTGWDMDPFCIVSFGQKVFRTRVIRHSRNPVWDEKLFFHVKRHEHAFAVMFTLFDWDKMSSNVRVSCDVQPSIC